MHFSFVMSFYCDMAAVWRTFITCLLCVWDQWPRYARMWCVYVCICMFACVSVRMCVQNVFFPCVWKLWRSCLWCVSNSWSLWSSANFHEMDRRVASFWKLTDWKDCWNFGELSRQAGYFLRRWTRRFRFYSFFLLNFAFFRKICVFASFFSKLRSFLMNLTSQVPHSSFRNITGHISGHLRRSFFLSSLKWAQTGSLLTSFNFICGVH